eukprot:31314-Pelagococcus_subviridis.AAC.43
MRSRRNVSEASSIARVPAVAIRFAVASRTIDIRDAVAALTASRDLLATTARAFVATACALATAASVRADVFCVLLYASIASLTRRRGSAGFAPPAARFDAPDLNSALAVSAVSVEPLFTAEGGLKTLGVKAFLLGLGIAFKSASSSSSAMFGTATSTRDASGTRDVNASRRNGGRRSDAPIAFAVASSKASISFSNRITSSVVSSTARTLNPRLSFVTAPARPVNAGAAFGGPRHAVNRFPAAAAASNVSVTSHPLAAEAAARNATRASSASDRAAASSSKGTCSRAFALFAASFATVAAVAASATPRSAAATSSANASAGSDLTPNAAAADTAAAVLSIPAATSIALNCAIVLALTISSFAARSRRAASAAVSISDAIAADAAWRAFSSSSVRIARSLASSASFDAATTFSHSSRSDVSSSMMPSARDLHAATVFSQHSAASSCPSAMRFATIASARDADSTASLPLSVASRKSSLALVARSLISFACLVLFSTSIAATRTASFASLATRPASFAARPSRESSSASVLTFVPMRTATPTDRSPHSISRVAREITASASCAFIALERSSASRKAFISSSALILSRASASTLVEWFSLARLNAAAAFPSWNRNARTSTSRSRSLCIASARIDLASSSASLSIPRTPPIRGDVDGSSSSSARFVLSRSGRGARRMSFLARDVVSPRPARRAFGPVPMSANGTASW